MSGAQRRKGIDFCIQAKAGRKVRPARALQEASGAAVAGELPVAVLHDARARERLVVMRLTDWLLMLRSARESTRYAPPGARSEAISPRRKGDDPWIAARRTAPPRHGERPSFSRGRAPSSGCAGDRR